MEEHGDPYRKALELAIREQGLVPPNRKIDWLATEYEEYIYVVGQLSWKLKKLGVGDGLLSQLLNVRFELQVLEEPLSRAEKRLLARRDVDETIYQIQQAIDGLDALAPGPAPEKMLKKDKAQFDKRVYDDEKRAELVSKWIKANKGDPQQER